MFHVVYRQHQSFPVVNSLCWHIEKKEHACTESSIKKNNKKNTSGGDQAQDLASD